MTQLSKIYNIKSQQFQSALVIYGLKHLHPCDKMRDNLSLNKKNRFLSWKIVTFHNGKRPTTSQDYFGPNFFYLSTDSQNLSSTFYDFWDAKGL